MSREPWWYRMRWWVSRVKAYTWCWLRHPAFATYPKLVELYGSGSHGPRHCIRCCPCWWCASLDCRDADMAWHAARDRAGR